jgi:arylformamidase
VDAGPEGVFRGYSQAELDAQYNAAGTVPSVDPYFADYLAGSAKLRDELEHERDVAYGPHERERVDFFPAQRPDAPLFVFIHGGYWRRMDSSYFSFVAGPVVRAGGAVAVLTYPLAPADSLDTIVASVERAFAFIAANATTRLNASPHGIVVGGHSAGGQLSGMLASMDWPARGVDASIAGVFGISGLYDLEPVRRSNVNDWLKLDEAAAARHSPSRHVPPLRTALVAAVGADETDEFRRQNRDFAALWQSAGYPARVIELPGHNHFSIVRELGNPSARLTGELLDALRLAEIKRMFFDRWDPIGINDMAPRDEYDTYAEHVWNLLRDGAQAGAVAEYLDRMTAEHMSLPEDHKAHNAEIAESVIAVNAGWRERIERNG